jgi:hypothetical protein
MESQSLLLRSQAIGPYPEPDESVSHISYLFKTHFNIISIYTHKSWSPVISSVKVAVNMAHAIRLVGLVSSLYLLNTKWKNTKCSWIIKINEWLASCGIELVSESIVLEWRCEGCRQCLNCFKEYRKLIVLLMWRLKCSLGLQVLTAVERKSTLSLRCIAFKCGGSLGTCQRDELPPSSGSKHFSCCLIVFLLDWILDLENRGSSFVRNVGNFLPDYKASHTTR